MVLIKNFLAPKITSLKCVGLEWEGQENLATCLVYHLPNAAEDALLCLLDALSSWALECPIWLVWRDFCVCGDDAAPSQARGLVAALGISQ